MDLMDYIVKHDGFIVSDGTCRDGDLLTSFLPIIEKYAKDDCSEIIKECYAFIGRHGQFGWLANLEGEISKEDYNRMEWIVSDWMWDNMFYIAPKEFYFGASEGDAACFGFWRDDYGEG